MLGSGSYGKVRKAIHLPTSRPVAVKELRKVKAPRKQRGGADGTDDEPHAAFNLEMIRVEIALLRSLDHRNVVKLFEVFETEAALWIVIEYVGGGDLVEVPFRHS